MTGVLVAQQRTGDLVLPVAAEQLVGLLRSWGPGPDHLTGLALAGVSVPSRTGPRFVDALVFTRCGVVVIAAHEPGPVTGAEPGPGARVGAAVAAAKAALVALGGGRYVTGLVVVVPPDSPWGATGPGAGPDARPEVVPHFPEAGLPLLERESSAPPVAISSPRAADSPTGVANSPTGTADSLVVSCVGHSGERVGHTGTPPDGEAAPRITSVELLAQEPAARTLTVRYAWPLLPLHEPDADVATVLADPRGLRRIITQHNRWRTVWTADDVLEACYALSLAHLAPPRSVLLAEGFPLRLPAAVKALPPEPEPREVAVEVVPHEVEAVEPAPLRPRGPVSAVFPRPRPIRQVPWGLVVVLSLLVTVGIIAAVFVSQVFHGG